MQQIADKMNFQDPVQKYAECHSWDMSNSNATKYHEIKVGILDNTCFKQNVPTFEILVGWMLRLGLNFWVINVALYGWKCDPAYVGTVYVPTCIHLFPHARADTIQALEHEHNFSKFDQLTISFLVP